MQYRLHNYQVMCYNNTIKSNHGGIILRDKKRIALYVRVSTGKEEQKTSLEHQDEGLRERAIREGHEIVGVYKDDGKTATKVYNRPDFMRLLYDAGIDHTYVYTDKKLPNGNVDRRSRARQIVFFESEREPLFDEIWVKNTSRLFRNLFFSEQILNILKNKKVAVFFVEQGFRTDQVSVDILIKICAIFDQQESQDKSSKVRWGYEQSFKNNNLRGKGPYGYYYDKVNKRLIINEEEAAVVRKIFELYVNEDYGIRRVLNVLNSEGILTPNGKPFAKTTLRRILSNPKYAGYNNLQKRWDSGVVFNKHSPREKRYGEYEIAPNPNIEPIISLDMFEKAQKRTEERNNNEIGVYKGNSIYSQRLVCGVCGAVYISNQDRGRHFFNCKTKKSKGLKFCSNPNISVKKFEAWLDEEAIRLKETVLVENKIKLYYLYHNLIAESLKLDEDNKAEIIHIQSLIEKTEAETEKLIMNRINAGNERELNIINKMIDKKLAEIDKLSIQKKELENALAIALEKIESINAEISAVVNFKYKDTYTKEDVLDFYDEFIVQSDGNITPSGYMSADWNEIKSSPDAGSMVNALYGAYKKIKVYLPKIIEYSEFTDEMPYRP